VLREEVSDNREAFEELDPLPIGAVHGPDEFAGAELSEHILAKCELADGDVAGGELAKAEYESDSDLADGPNTGSQLT